MRRPDVPEFDDVPRPGGTISLLVAALFVGAGVLVGWAIWA